MLGINFMVWLDIGVYYKTSTAYKVENFKFQWIKYQWLNPEIYFMGMKGFVTSTNVERRFPVVSWGSLSCGN